MVRLVDHADLYLSLFRSNRWLRKYVSVTGDWPTGNSPFIAITFHWGAGMWALRHMRAQGRKVSVLVRGAEREYCTGGLFRYAGGKLRLREVTRSGGSRIILSGKNSLFEMKRKLKAGVAVLGLVDVPSGEPRNYLIADLLGKQAHFPRGLLHLAVNSKVPVVVYSMGLDRQSGRRNLVISPPLQFETEEELLHILVSRLNELIYLDSPAWYQWGGVQSFFDKGNEAG